MKNIVTVLVLLFSFFISESMAQIPFEKSRRIKTLELNVVASGSGEEAYIDFSHKYLKIINSKIALGYEANFNAEIDYINEYTAIEFGPMVRYVVRNSDKDYTFVDLNILFGVDWDDDSYTAIKIAPSYAYFLTKNVAIESKAILKFQGSKAVTTFNGTYNSSKLVLGFQVGLQMYFDRLFDFSKKEFWKPNG